MLSSTADPYKDQPAFHSNALRSSSSLLPSWSQSSTSYLQRPIHLTSLLSPANSPQRRLPYNPPFIHCGLKPKTNPDGGRLLVRQFVVSTEAGRSVATHSFPSISTSLATIGRLSSQVASAHSVRSSRPGGSPTSADSYLSTHSTSSYHSSPPCFNTSTRTTYTSSSSLVSSLNSSQFPIYPQPRPTRSSTGHLIKACAASPSTGNRLYTSSSTTTTPIPNDMTSTKSFYDLKAELPGTKGVYDFAQLKGKVVLIVNVASQWRVSILCFHMTTVLNERMATAVSRPNILACRSCTKSTRRRTLSCLASHATRQVLRYNYN